MEQENKNSDKHLSLHNLRDLISSLNVNGSRNLAGTINGYQHILKLMRELSDDDDGILTNRKLKRIQDDLLVITTDEDQLTKCVAYLNDAALTDHDTGVKFSMLFGSYNFRTLRLKDGETRVRNIVLAQLEMNHKEAKSDWCINDRKRYCNSATMLGEYYFRVRYADETPISILGKSLLELLLLPLNVQTLCTRMARLLLRQMTLNGKMMHQYHKNEFQDILFEIRRNIIEKPDLEKCVKALLLMTLELYYNFIINVNEQESAKTLKYYYSYVEQSEEQMLLLNENSDGEQTAEPSKKEEVVVEEHVVDLENAQSVENNINDDNDNVASKNVYEEDNTAEDSSCLIPSGKKWSEQVSDELDYEQSLSEFDAQQDFENATTASVKSNEIAVQQQQQHNEPVGNDDVYGYEQGAESNDLDYNDKSSSTGNWRGRRRSPVQQRRVDTYPLRDCNNTLNADYGNRNYGNKDDNQKYKIPQMRWTHSERVDNQRYEDDAADGRDNSLRLYSVESRRKYYESRKNKERVVGVDSYGGGGGGGGGSEYRTQFDKRATESQYGEYRNNYQRRNYGRGRLSNRQQYETPPRFLQNQQQNAGQQQQQQYYRSDFRRRHNGGYQDENDYEESESYNRHARKPSTSGKYHNTTQ